MLNEMKYFNLQLQNCELNCKFLHSLDMCQNLLQQFNCCPSLIVTNDRLFSDAILCVYLADCRLLKNHFRWGFAKWFIYKQFWLIKIEKSNMWFNSPVDVDILNILSWTWKVRNFYWVEMQIYKKWMKIKDLGSNIFK